ncbi:MAG: hypothetical protein ACKV2Q_22805 [Planctomycetaceae bacterium]
MKSKTVTTTRKGIAEPPDSVRAFVATWKTVALSELWPDAVLEEAESMYSQYWYRAVAAMALSGRVAPTNEGRPNKTEGLRLCKEANFNPQWLDELAWFLVQARVIKPEGRNKYVEGEAFAAFDQHEFGTLQKAVQQGVIGLTQGLTGYQVWRPTPAHNAGLIEFLTLFAAAFPGVAVRESDLLLLWRGLSELPAQDLVEWANHQGVPLELHQVRSWHHWFDQKGVSALRHALYSSRWAYGTSFQNDIWLGLSFDAQSLVGGIAPLPRQSLTDQLEVDDSGHVLAGSGLPIGTLAQLCRLCRVTKIRAVLEFQIDKKRLAQLPVSESPSEELRGLLGATGSLSSKVEKLLGGASPRGGRMLFAHCSGVVIPENDEVAKAIRQHPRLKGYLAPNAPPGLLLIKPDSDPSNFITRCRELGFEVTWR